MKRRRVAPRYAAIWPRSRARSGRRICARAELRHGCAATPRWGRPALLHHQ